MRQVALLLLLAGQGDRAEKLFEKVSFGKVESRGEGDQRVLAIVADKVHWVGAFKRIEDKIGPWPEDLAVTVTFDLEGEDPSRADCHDHKGFIQFNLPRLAQYQKKIDELDQKKKELAKEGKRVVFKVTPLRIERLVYHELTVVLQQDLEAPFWFHVGMASWIGDDMNYLTGFAHSGKKVENIEVPFQEQSDYFGRGHVFWKWLEMKGAAKSAAKTVLYEKAPWKKALEDATGLSWEKLTAAEREWSEKQVEKLRSPSK